MSRSNSQLSTINSPLIDPGYKQTEVGVIPEDWSDQSLGELSDFVTSGPRGWAQFYSESGALFIRSQNVRQGYLSFEDMQYVSPPTGADGDRTKISRNDVLITITGNSVGNVAMVAGNFDEAYISQHVGLVRLKDTNKGPYICRYLSPNSPGNPQIAGSQSGQSKPGLNLQNIRDFRIAMPPTTKETDAIASALSDVDALLGALDRLIAKKRDLKQAAMQQLLTGQTRLPGFKGEWAVTVLGDLLTMRATYGIVTAGEFRDSGVPMMRGGDIKGGRVGFDLPFVSPEKSSEYSRTVLKQNDVVIALVGYPGEAAKVPARLEGANISRAVGLLRLSKRIEPDYLVSYLNSSMGRQIVLAPSAGSAQLVVNLAELNKLEFLFWFSVKWTVG